MTKFNVGDTVKSVSPTKAVGLKGEVVWVIPWNEGNNNILPRMDLVVDFENGVTYVVREEEVTNA